jgi:protein gp37
MYIDHEFISCYVDSDFNPISGREDVYDLCNKCYNNIMGAAVKEFIKQKLKNK